MTLGVPYESPEEPSQFIRNDSRPYVDGTTADHIIKDGWSRGFTITQTIRELKEMGYDISEDVVHLSWEEIDRTMLEFLKASQAAFLNPTIDCKVTKLPPGPGPDLHVDIKIQFGDQHDQA